MSWLGRLRRTILGSSIDRDFDEEVRFHLEEGTEENLRDGMTVVEAHRDARHRLGNLPLARDQVHDVETVRWLADLGRDVRDAVRALRRSPVFTLAALATLAVGIGANAAIFSLLNAVLLKPLPYPEPARMVTLGYTFQGIWVPLLSPAKFAVWRGQTGALDEIAAFRNRPAYLTDAAGGDIVAAAHVSADFFHLFGATVVQGRAFTAADDRTDSEAVVVLSFGCWQRRFGGDPAMLGRSVTVDGRTAVVIGVIDAGFDTAIFNSAPDLWLPLRLDPASTDHPPSLMAVGRLKPGISVEMANVQAQVAGREFHRRFPEASGADDTFCIAPFQEVMVQGARWSMLVLAGAVGLVLVIACGNVANLLLVRASVRKRELAIRAALGAGRGRLIRQLLAESLLLALGGGAIGLAIDRAAIHALVMLIPGDIPRIGPDAAGVITDWRVLAFTLLVSLTTGVAFGLIPAFQVSRGNLATVLKRATGPAGSGVGPRTAAAWLVMGEVSLALVLLVGAALLIRTVIALRVTDRGFDPHQVLSVRLSTTVPLPLTTNVLAQLVASGRERLGAIPGVVSVGATCCLPLESDWRTSFAIIGRPPPPRVTVVSYRIVSPGYFDVLKIRLLRGRAFTERDAASAPPVVLINQALARQWWSDGNPLGERLIAFPGLVPDDEPARDIVGIVSDVHDGTPLDPEPQPTIYVPMAQLLDRETAGWPLTWVVRTAGAPERWTSAVQRELGRVNAAPVSQAIALDDIVHQSTVSSHFYMIVLTLFAGIALLLAAIGVYGVVAYTVQQRTHEMGIRLALGATRRQIQRLIVVQSLRPVCVRTAVGLAAAFGLVRVLRSLLFGVTPHDVLVFVTAPMLLAVVSLGAIWLPARRAPQVDPAQWLNTD